MHFSNHDQQIAIVILAHRNPGQVRALISRLASARIRIFLHVDRACPDVRSFIPPGQDVFLIEQRLRVGWGDPSLVDAIFHSLSEARRHAASARHFCLISGQDWPLKDAGEIASTLITENRAGHICGWPLPRATLPGGGLTRVQHYWAPGWIRPALLRRIGQRLLSLLPDRPLEHLPALWFGSAWFDLRADLLDYLLDFVRRNPDYRRAFRLTRCTDEIFFHTIVFNSPFKDELSCGDPDRCLLGLRYIDWTRGGSHPRALGPEDMHAARATGALFARKFDRPPEP